MYTDPSPVDDIAEHPQSGEIVTLSTTVSAPLNYSTTSTTFEEPTSTSERAIADWSDVNYDEISNYFLRWGLYAVSESTSGQTSTFELYGFGNAPGSVSGSSFTVAGGDGTVFRQMNQVSIDPANFGVWTPVPRFKTDGGQANIYGVLSVLLMGEIA